MEVRLKEDAKIIDRLTRENINKESQIDSMNAALQKERERHEIAVDSLRTEAETQHEEADHTIQVRLIRLFTS